MPTDKRVMTPEQRLRKAETDRLWRIKHNCQRSERVSVKPTGDAPKLQSVDLNGFSADPKDVKPPESFKYATNDNSTTDEIKHIDSDWSKLIPHGLEEYIEQDSEKTDLRLLLASGFPILLLGDKGVGKSLLARKIAEEDKIPVFTFNGSMGVTEDDMLGYMANLGVFIDGIVTQAVKCAQTHGSAMLIMEEINAIPAGVTMCLHPLLDFVKSLIVRITGEVLNMNGNAGKLYIIATANIGTEGTQAMNTAFKSRFGAKLYIEFPKTITFKRILERDSADEEIITTLVNIVNGLRTAYKNSELADAPSIREAVNAVRAFNTFSKQYPRTVAFTKACNYTLLEEMKYNSANYDVAKNIIKSHAGSLYEM
jgi:MoxR-like ATPase